nr:hypothetical protein SHINE37_40637 [Rhizobiaceae bacterium]
MTTTPPLPSSSSSGFDPRVHAARAAVDGRVKPDHDGGEVAALRAAIKNASGPAGGVLRALLCRLAAGRQHGGRQAFISHAGEKKNLGRSLPAQGVAARRSREPFLQSYHVCHSRLQRRIETDEALLQSHPARFNGPVHPVPSPPDAT